MSFIHNFYWFCRHWHPICLKWHSPRLIWRVAMSRDKIRALFANDKKQDVEA